MTKKTSNTAVATPAVSAHNWSDRAWKVLKEMARKRKKPFTSEDLVARVGRPNNGGSIGALLRRAQRENVIQAVDWTTSTSATRKHARIRTWIGA